MILKKDFFNRNSVRVAKDLIGTFLVRIDERGKKEKFKIVETEAYEGFKDLASHASRGKTNRNAPMFEKPGTIYVYFTYGMHYMFNIVCGAKGYPSAVLIRGLEGVTGPGRLTKRLNINKNLNDLSLGKKAGIWVEEDPREAIKIKKKIKRTPRIGVSYAGDIWSQKPYRFILIK